MGAVAPQAVARGGRVRLLLLHLFLEIHVAGEAEIGAPRQHQLVQFRLVRTVAFRALPRGNGGMPALPALQSVFYFRMALEADLVLLRDDHPPEIGRVGVVARQALPPPSGAVARRAGRPPHSPP